MFVRNAKAEFKKFGAVVEKFTTDANVSPSDVDALITLLDSIYVCPGNSDATFVHLCKRSEGVLKNTSMMFIAYLDRHSSFTFSGEHYQETVRKSDCHLLISSAKRRC